MATVTQYISAANVPFGLNSRSLHYLWIEISKSECASAKSYFIYFLIYLSLVR